MPISEAARNDLYTGLAQVLGQDRAETLMSAIPLHDLDQVATKSDIALLRAELGAELGGLRSELGAELGGLRSEMEAESGFLRAELGTLATSIHRVDKKLDRLIFVLITGLFAVIATLIGVGLLS